jgi:hypothetical protein
MRKHIVFLLCTLLLIVMLPGCDYTDESELEKRLIGVLVTRSPLPNETVYAEWDEEMRWFAFPEELGGMELFRALAPPLEGIGYFRISHSDPAFHFPSGSLNHVRVMTDETVEPIQPTVYTLPGDRFLQVNPIYQNADGRVFAVRGAAFSHSGDGLTASSTTLNDYFIIDENGGERRHTTIITVTMAAKLPPERVVFAQMDAHNREIARNEYAPHETPRFLDLLEETAFVILETHQSGSAEEPVLREMHGRGDTVITFVPRPDGILERRDTQLR